MSKKVKKISPYRKLQEELRTSRELCDLIRYSEQQKIREIEQLNRKLRERLDQSMLEERIKLANALGQMMNQTCEAVKFIIAKEVM